jgi:hypothetical protein
MASNFGIAIDKNSDGFGLKLQGDFDATSAYELIYAIMKLSGETVKISIYTNGLKNIYPFGLDVFHKHMRSRHGQFTKIVFTGNNASRLSLGDSRPASQPSFRDGGSVRHFLSV